MQRKYIHLELSRRHLPGKPARLSALPSTHPPGFPDTARTVHRTPSSVNSFEVHLTMAALRTRRCYDFLRSDPSYKDLEHRVGYGDQPLSAEAPFKIR